MPATQRLEALAQRCRTIYPSSPESLIMTIYRIPGEKERSMICREVQRAGKSAHYAYADFLRTFPPTAEYVEEMDVRLPGICLVTGPNSVLISPIAAIGPVERARNHLRSSGRSEQDHLPVIVVCSYPVKRGYTPIVLLSDIESSWGTPPRIHSLPALFAMLAGLCQATVRGGSPGFPRSRAPSRATRCVLSERP